MADKLRTLRKLGFRARAVERCGRISRLRLLERESVTSLSVDFTTHAYRILHLNAKRQSTSVPALCKCGLDQMFLLHRCLPGMLLTQQRAGRCVHFRQEGLLKGSLDSHRTQVEAMSLESPVPSHRARGGPLLSLRSIRISCGRRT